jgi:hypothetical protein
MRNRSMFFKNLLCGFIVGLIASGIFESIFLFIPILRINYWDNPKLIFGYHFHHSILGLIVIFIGIYKKLSFLIGFGIGIIFVHTITDGNFVFVNM